MNKLNEKVLNFLELEVGKKFKQKEIAKAVGVKGNNYRKFKRILTEMSDTDKIRKYGKSRYSSNIGKPVETGKRGRTRNASKREGKSVEGVLSVTMRGFGFLLVEDGPDIFISSDDMSGALGGDIVKVRVFPRKVGPSSSGKVIEIVERKRTKIVGTLIRNRGRLEVVPDERALRNNIPIMKGKEKKGKPGQKVVARIIEESLTSANISVEIVEVIGYPDEQGTDFRSICVQFGLFPKFPQNVEKESSALKEGIEPDELNKRLDLRDELCFTIDPVEAKDFDDAVSIKLLENGNYQLGIHIADVSHFVKEGTFLDREALKRATSVYLIDNVVPMLPERISNGLCSLVPNEERYAFSVILEVTQNGVVENYQLKPSLIKSKKRFTYHEVSDILHKGKGEYFKELSAMNKLAKTLSKNRKSSGSIDFDLSEAIFRLDEKGMPIDVFRSERLDSHRLVEEFMLLANKIVATHISLDRSKEKLPFLYRIHERPKEDEIKNFLEMLKFVGVKINVPSPIRSEDFRDIMTLIEKLPEKDLLEKIALRSMSKAIYSENNIGHFALAFKHYTHFTSPIRRYSDLLIHRLLKKYSGKNLRSARPGSDKMRKTAAQCTEREINALRAERAHARIKEVKFLSGKIGEKFEGIISGVISSGLFVELLEFPVEGFISVSSFRDDYYVFEKEKHRLLGKDTKKSFMLGDKLEIRVKNVKIAERQVDFSPVKYQSV